MPRFTLCFGLFVEAQRVPLGDEAAKSPSSLRETHEATREQITMWFTVELSCKFDLERSLV